MGNGGGLLGLHRALFGMLILVGFVLCLVVGMLESVKSETNQINLSKSELAGKFNLIKVIDHNTVEKLEAVGPNSDFNYNMSKRRVPNGPDPIHNRKAGNSGRPPGQA